MPAMDKIAGNLFLIGLMAAGKTTIGKQLAQVLGLAFHDSDQEIVQKTGASINTIFAVEGEAGFRDREEAVIDSLSQQHSIVLATGGGAILRDNNRRYLQERGTVIYLHTSIDTILARTQFDKTRPLLQVDNPRAKLEPLYQARDPLYRSIADIIVSTEHGQVNDIIQEITAALHLKQGQL